MMHIYQIIFASYQYPHARQDFLFILNSFFFYKQVLGNHEFDHGVDGLVPYLELLNSTMLGANVNTTFEPTMTPYVKNHVVVERHGRKIGIIGVLLRVVSWRTLIQFKMKS